MREKTKAWTIEVDMRGDGASDCSKAPEVEIGRSSEISIYIYIDIYSFITEIYIAPLSRLLLRSAPDPCTAKEKSFEARVKCVRKNPGEQSLL